MRVNKWRFAFWTCITITVICLFWVFISNTELSDETKELVEDLRWKHYGHFSIICTDDSIFYDGIIEWNRDYLSMWVEGDRFYIETQDGKWFIEMTKVEEVEGE